MDETLETLAKTIAERLRARRETVAVAESSAGGLISAALLSVPGASDYYLGGAVVYTAKAFRSLIGLPREALAGIRSSSEPYALLLARTVRENHDGHLGGFRDWSRRPDRQRLWRRGRSHLRGGFGRAGAGPDAGNRFRGSGRRTWWRSR